MALPTSALVEIEFTAGGWVTVTSDVSFSDGISITNRGKPTEFDPVGPSVLSLYMYNNDGKYTPDNPASPNYPNVVEDVRIRVTMTVNGQTSMRFFGYITSWEPDFYADVSTLNKVKITASDNLYALASYRMRPLWIEESKRLTSGVGRYGSSFEFNGLLGASQFSDAGSVPTPNFDNYAKTDAFIVPSKTGQGSFVKSSAENLLVPGSIQLNPSKTTPYYGPYIDLKLMPGMLVHNFVFKVNDTAAVLAAGSLTIASFYSVADGNRPIAYLKAFAVGGVVKIQLTDAADVSITNTSYEVSSDRWVAAILQVDSVDPSRTNLLLNFDNLGYAGYFTLPINFVFVDRVFLGGKAYFSAAGKGYNCSTTEFATYHASSSRTGYPGVGYIMPGFGSDPGNVAATRFCNFVRTSSGLQGTDYGRVLYSDVTGTDVLSVQQKISQSIGSIFWAKPDGFLVSLFKDYIRTNNIAFTLDLGLDDASTDLTVTRTVDTTPTKVTVEAAFGTVILSDPDARVNREINLLTFNDTSDSAYAVAGKELSRSRALRVSSVTVDLVTGSNANTLTPILFNAYPGTRFLLRNLNPIIFGYTQAEYFVVGWSEFYSPTQVVFNVDTEPADLPVTGEFDSATYARMGTSTMTATGGTALTTTSVGTLILARGAEPPLTIDAAMYPLDLDVGGERMTISSPPASAVSPQTVTVTARGAVPTVAFAHSAGTVVDLWRSTAFTF